MGNENKLEHENDYNKDENQKEVTNKKSKPLGFLSMKEALN
jgi:hypothetical protein